MKDLRFPIGPLSEFKRIEVPHRAGYVEEIGQFPNLMIEKVQSLSNEELALAYRPDGWNIAQVVHHCADSHLNAYARFRLALTEERPKIRPYYEERWAELPDAMSTNLEPSLNLLKGVHHRWRKLLLSMSKEQWLRTYLHPEHHEEYELIEALAQYVWHCRHHLAHIDQALERKHGR